MTDELIPFDAYEIHGCMSITGDINIPLSERALVEQCDDAEAQFWSLFGHVTGEGLHCIGDFNTRHDAESILYRIEAVNVHEALAKRRQIAIIWGIEDVQILRPDLDDAKAWVVLEACESSHDECHGISWDTIEATAEGLYPEPDSNEAGEEE